MITTIGDWHFEVIGIRARKVKVYGDNYEAVATITVTDGEPHIEGLLGINGFSHADKEVMRKYLLSQGFTHFTSSKFVNGDREVSGFTLTI